MVTTSSSAGTDAATTVMVLKRRGGFEKFSASKAAKSVKAACGDLCTDAEAASIVNELLAELKERESVSALELAERIERLLISRAVENVKWLEVAKRYELGKIYKDVFGVRGDIVFDPRDLALTFNAVKVLASRYLMKNPETGRFTETPQMLFRRVAKNVAAVELKYCVEARKEECEAVARYWEERFYELMSDLRFLPNSPTLMNAGTRLGLLSACFVVPVRDSIVTEDGEGIYDAVRAQAVIFQQGGGVGYDFSELRPEGDVVTSTGGLASGPLSFMKVFDLNTEVIKQGGRRRGANMGVLHVWHPDVEKFVDSKSGKLKELNLQNFNISVGVYDYFMEAVLRKGKVPLINPRKTWLRGDNGYDSRFYTIVMARHYMDEEWVQELIIDETERSGGAIWLDESLIITMDEALIVAEDRGGLIRYIEASKLFDKMAENAWDSGEPGILFIDTINRRHPTWYLGKINATNPCGEQPLLPWESCNLGSINLAKYVYINHRGEARIDWAKLADDVKVITRFMDDVIDAAKWPLQPLERAVKRTRKIGIGVMGWAHMLIMLGIPYDSVDAIYLAYYLAEWIEYNAAMASVELAKERGSFPAYDSKHYRPTWFSTKPIEELLALAGVKEKPSEKLLSLISERPPVDWETLEILRKDYGIRNATLTSIAPTGTISIIAGTTSGIEPLFAVAFERHVSVGTFIEIDRLFLELLRKYELDSPEVIRVIAERGSVSDIPFIPKTIRALFRVAHDVEPKWHVLHQAAWQQWICGGVSKTVNMRAEASVDDVKEIFVLAWRLGCKGITVYRDKSKSRQVIYVGIKMGPSPASGMERRAHEGPQQWKPYTKGFVLTRSRTIEEAIEELARHGCQICEY